MKYREKHIEIEALQYEGRWLDMLRWLDQKGQSPQDVRATRGCVANEYVTLVYLDVEVGVSIGNWVCLNDDLGVFVLPDDTYKMLFEEVGDQPGEDPDDRKIKIRCPGCQRSGVFARFLTDPPLDDGTQLVCSGCGGVFEVDLEEMEIMEDEGADDAEPEE